MNIETLIIQKELDRNVIELEVYCEKARCISEGLTQGYYSIPDRKPERILLEFDGARIENSIVDDYLYKIAKQIDELKQKLGLGT